MKTLKQKGNQCMVTSLAMILDEDPEDLLKEIGHDGMKEAWPELLGNFRCVGHHPDEFQDVCFKRGLALAMIELNPMSAPSAHCAPHCVYPEGTQREQRFRFLIKGRRAILAFRSAHAMAWDGHKVHDPAVGKVYDLEDVHNVICALVLTKLL